MDVAVASENSWAVIMGLQRALEKNHYCDIAVRLHNGAVRLYNVRLYNGGLI